ncbi:hypothetical protein CTheo_7208 [Ceratobasidium theobromae]|uniref:Uncharacterized protein n=1 Tax=Ceratobasidium theobromae TaxID=1582974 RepID=A0A5N5QCE6_9AGAM|nr:hypothetical protein CTheo_7208 [Ceratobasidium theobromae]
MYFSTRTIFSTLAVTLLATSVAAAPAVVNTPDLSGRQCRKCHKEATNATTTIEAPAVVVSTPDVSARQCRKCHKGAANDTTTVSS